MNLKWSSAATSVMRATNARAAAGSRYSSTKRIRRYPRPSAVILDDASACSSSSSSRPRSWSPSSARCASCFVDLRHREADVDQHPVAGREVLVLQQADVDDPTDTAHVDPREVLMDLEQLDHLSGDARGTRSVLPLGDDLDPHADLRLHLQHQDPRRVHPEVADVEGGLATRAAASRHRPAITRSPPRRSGCAPLNVTSPCTR